MANRMTHRQRLEAVLDRRRPDRLPWFPRLELWYQAHRLRGDLPEKYRGWTLRQIEKDLGMGTPAREGRVCRTELRGVEVRSEERNGEILTEYCTPRGVVSTLHRGSRTLEQGGIAARMQVGHLIRGPEDYPAVEYLIEHTEILPAYEDYLAYDAEIGEDGLPMVHAGQEPMYRILQDLIGFNQAFFHLADYYPLVMHLYETLLEQARRIQQVVLDSPARLILHGEHFDSLMTPPPLFRQYMLAYFQEYAEKLHARGKALACHADADTSRLLELIKEAGFDMAECFVTAPMVKVTLAEARAAFGSQVILWGGIPSVLLCDPVTEEEFERYLTGLFRIIAPGEAFILGVADNVMAEARFERIARVSELVNK
jgi:hypothetical protein